jgi:hypothetical protein
MQTHEISVGLKHLIETGLPRPKKPLSRGPGKSGAPKGNWMPKFQGDKIHRMTGSGRKKRSV